MLGKMELFRRAYSCFSNMDLFTFEEIASGNGAFQEIYSSFSEKRHAFVWVKWQISVQPLHNIIILIGSKN